MVQEKDRAEFIGQIIDIVEDFLDKKEPRETKEAYIQGEWYDLLAGKLTDMMKNWDVLAEPGDVGAGKPDAATGTPDVIRRIETAGYVRDAVRDESSVH